MTLEFSNLTGSACTLDLLWDNIAVGIPISTNTDGRVMAQINNVLVKDNRPYYQAAFYYLENGKDLNQALAWFDKAIAQDPTAYFAVYQKARCLAKLGRKHEAITTAQKSIELAKQQQNNDYVVLNQKLIASLQ
jgi:tetratricopeptide (TPR) repeat protein